MTNKQLAKTVSDLQAYADKLAEIAGGLAAAGIYLSQQINKLEEESLTKLPETKYVLAGGFGNFVAWCRLTGINALDNSWQSIDVNQIRLIPKRSTVIILQDAYLSTEWTLANRLLLEREATMDFK
jgi:hypothetical protein